MTARKQQLYNTIEKLPEELLTKVIDYIEYLEFSNVNNKAPEELTIKDKEDLISKKIPF